jgi:preprotein translocase subunit SecG
MLIRIISIIAYVLIVVLLYQDAKSRDMKAILWAILFLVFPVVTIIIYFLIRKPKMF